MIIYKVVLFFWYGGRNVEDIIEISEVCYDGIV